MSKETQLGDLNYPWSVFECPRTVPEFSGLRPALILAAVKGKIPTAWEVCGFIAYCLYHVIRVPWHNYLLGLIYIPTLLA